MKLRKIGNRFRNNTICIMGIDGTGKTSTINKLREMLGNEVIVQYMGQKYWETKVAQSVMKKPKKTVIDKMKWFLALYIEMWFRRLKKLFSNKVIIYDRFPSEVTLKVRGTRKKIYGLLYFIMPRPKITFYLTCDLSTSLKRKDDINTESEINKLRQSKKSFDEKYLNNSQVISINTDKRNQDDVISLILSNLPSYMTEKTYN